MTRDWWSLAAAAYAGLGAAMALHLHATRTIESILEHPPWEVVWAGRQFADVVRLSTAPPAWLAVEAGLTALAWVTAAAAWVWGPSRRQALLIAAMPVAFVWLYHLAWWRWEDRALSLVGALAMALLVCEGRDWLVRVAALCGFVGVGAVTLMLANLGPVGQLLAYQSYATCYVALQVVLTIGWLARWRHGGP